MEYLPRVRQSVVVLLLLLVVTVVLLAQLLPNPADPLRGLPQRETLREVAQVKLLPIEDLSHVPGVARVESDPGEVRWKSLEHNEPTSRDKFL